MKDMHRMRNWVGALVPSFLACSSSHPEQTIRPTAWLDGLRGWASLIVFSFHFTHAYHKWSSFGYGSDGNWLFVELPFVRIFYAGEAMVYVFFIVSGYSLAWGMLQFLLHSNKH
jgi:peptidoglycan/LPS O-acetylase OafA/YrhL